MLTPRLRLNRAVAALLPASLMWVFAACVSICGWESAESRPRFASAAAATEVKGAPCCEGCPCPDASFLRATTAERATFKHDLQTAGDVATSVLPVASTFDAVTSVPAHRRQFLAGPPLELLPTLRI
ncbi:MAG: hypothetical protein ABW208_05890 [Pyrinomonadaceae bacterium]